MLRQLLRYSVDDTIDKAYRDGWSPDEVGAEIVLHCHAARQPKPGTFDSIRHLRVAMEGPGAVPNAGYGGHVDRFVERGTVRVQQDGRVVVEGWDSLQEGDATVAERMRRLRARRASSPPDADVEAAPVTTDTKPAVTGDTNAAVTTDTVANVSRTPPDVGRQTSDDGRSEEKTPKAVPVRARAESLRRLTKADYDRVQVEWASFDDAAWGPFREAWTERGFVLPPWGDANDEDETTQRARLHRMVDARPTDSARWVREAPGRTTRDVVDHIFSRWSALEDEAAEREAADVAEQRSRRAEPVGPVVARLLDSGSAPDAPSPAAESDGNQRTTAEPAPSTGPSVTVDDPRFRRVVAAMEAVVDRPWMRYRVQGVPCQTLLGLVDRHGPDAVIAGLERARRSFGPYLVEFSNLIEASRGLLDGGDLEASA